MFQESAVESWSQRYGSEPPPDLPPVEAFLRHRTVRKFAGRPVPESTIQALVACAQSAATSSYSMPWTLVSVESSEKRARIAQLCGDQKQILMAPWFFCVCCDLYRSRVLGESVEATPDAAGTAEALIVATVDASLAAERMVCAAESIGMGICYIGALRNDPVGVAEVLDLPEGVFGLFGLCLGYPSEEDTRAIIKPRLPQEVVWHRDQYNREPDVAAFEETMVEFYPKIGMDASSPWSLRQARRFSMGYLQGRETLDAELRKRGFLTQTTPSNP